MRSGDPRKWDLVIRGGSGSGDQEEEENEEVM